MGVTAANVPSFRGQSSLSLGDLQDLVEVVKALMLQADSPPGRVRTGSAKAVPAHDPPDGGVYFNGKFYDKKIYFRPRAGLVQDLAFQEGLTEPCFVQGHGLLPLAEADEMSTGGSSVGSSVDSTGGSAVGKSIPGGIAGIRYVADLTAPRIAPGGIIELPPGGGGSAPVPRAQWTQEGEDQVPGVVRLLTIDSAYKKPFATDGHIYFPLAETVDASRVDRQSAVAGAIAGIRYAEQSAEDPSAVGSGVDTPTLAAPRILPGGIIELPRPAGALQGVVDTGGGQNTWAAIESGVSVQVAQTVLNFPGGAIPLSLYVGLQNGFLSFSLSDST